MEVEKVYELPFAPAVVYAAWVSSQTVIPPATAMDVLPEVGGHYRLVMDSPEFSGRNEGKFSFVEPGRRLTYTWEWDGDGEVTEVDVRFTEIAGGTQVRIVHSGFAKEESVASHDAGWDGYLAGFTEFLHQKQHLG